MADMEGMKAIPYIFLVVAVAGIIGGAASIVVSEFGNTMTKCENTTAGVGYRGNGTSCANASGQLYGNVTDEYLVVLNTQDGINVTAQQLSTIAIIGVMVIIIGLIAGVFVYFKYFSN